MVASSGCGSSFVGDVVGAPGDWWGDIAPGWDRSGKAGPGPGHRIHQSQAMQTHPLIPGRLPMRFDLRLLCLWLAALGGVGWGPGLRAADPGRVLHLQESSTVTGPWTAIAQVRVASTSTPAFYRVAWESGKAVQIPAGFAWIESGRFMMGTPDTEVGRRTAEGPRTGVRISEGFWMSQYETTQREWVEVMSNNGSSVLDPDLPVDSVSYEDAMEYCTRLTQRESAAGRLPEGYVYRLPTEAEWEYACRAGTTNATSFGDSLSSTNANFDGTQPYGAVAAGPAVGSTVRGGLYPPNAWGLYDMHGNVWEWCGDWHPSRLPGGWVTDPVGAGSTKQRALRGGAWHNEGALCRSGYRYLIGPIFRAFSSGLRPVIARALYP